MQEEPSVESIGNAKLLEKDNDLKGALAMYQALLKIAKNSVPILTRCVVVSRKLKLYKKELSYLNQLIKLLEGNYGKKIKVNSATKALSEKLNVSLGHVDKKGNPKITPEEISRLEKRKLNLLKKL